MISRIRPTLRFAAGALFFLAVCTAALWGRPTRKQEERFRKHLYTLAGETFAGRGSQTVHDTMAVDYIRDYLGGLEGMEFLFGDGLQPFTSHSRDGRVSSFNVGAILDGSDPDRADEIVVVGAHYDHMGWQVEDFKEKILYGADDNASGTAMVLELARYFSAHRSELKRSVAFLFFGAEEKGLVGSNWFLDHPPFEKETIFAMVNMDMVGRLTTERGLRVIGTGSSPEMDRIVRTTPPEPLVRLTKIHYIADNEAASDHQPFFKAGIPVLFFNTGSHTDYHRSTDIPQTINYYGMALIHDYAKDVILRLANEETVTRNKPAIHDQMHE